MPNPIAAVQRTTPVCFGRRCARAGSGPIDILKPAGARPLTYNIYQGPTWQRSYPWYSCALVCDHTRVAPSAAYGLPSLSRLIETVSTGEEGDDPQSIIVDEGTNLLFHSQYSCALVCDHTRVAPSAAYGLPSLSRLIETVSTGEEGDDPQSIIVDEGTNLLFHSQRHASDVSSQSESSCMVAEWVTFHAANVP
jgi:hypothetical protein